MRVGRWDFTPSIAPTLATVVCLPLLVSLGFWQLDRAEQKEALHRSYVERSSAAPRDSESVRGTLMNNGELLFRRLRIHGRYDPGVHFLLDNQVYRGAPGYDVVTPFVPEGETLHLLVDRGWIPAGPDRGRVPLFETPAESLEITGLAKPPSRPGLVLADAPPEAVSDGIRRLQYIDPERIALLMGWTVPAYVIRLEAASPGGFVRDWPEPGSGSERHLGYAFQWFALAVLLAIIFVVVNLKRREV